MSHDAPAILHGVVDATLPKGLFRVRLDAGSVLRAALSSQARRVVVKLLPGDRVRVSRSPNDPTRGRILEKLP